MELSIYLFFLRQSSRYFKIEIIYQLNVGNTGSMSLLTAFAEKNQTVVYYKPSRNKNKFGM